MTSNHYGRAAEKLSAARRTLMAPHPHGEVDGFARAFNECDLGLHNIRPEDLDDNARSWVETIRSTMDTTGIAPSGPRGTYWIKAERLTVDERINFSSAVDQLATWLHDKFWDRK